MSNVNPSAVLVGAENAGVTPASSAVPVTEPNELSEPLTLTITSTVEESPGARPVTVTCPSLSMAAVPPLLAPSVYSALGS